MAIGKSPEIPSSEITPKSVYLNRRNFMKGTVALGAAALGGYKLHDVFGARSANAAPDAGSAIAPALGRLNYVKGSYSTSEKLTPLKDVTHYNNFYEFSTDKEGPAELAGSFQPLPWSVAVEGLAQKPRTYDMDALLKLAPLEERVYRMRCVEGWSMVIPWIGFPLSALLKQVGPTSAAKFVEFTSVLRPSQMPGQKRSVLDWPYVEGLRLDEAMHPLTILAVGLYGETLPNQDGAPIRLVVPWKYGFKSAKSIVKIRLTADMPQTTWNKASSVEYGFYSNVNPEVDHPRWSQANERRIGEFGKRPTLMFNGYGDQVASLYAGMDLRKWF
ncbi:MAG: protein-methionine-sulfoxide reductase catalytic subunit MsrP [Candidatus Korobacteraceae bacterium]|jgi:sulfoxide reductase catalytic subunit YedY